VQLFQRNERRTCACIQSFAADRDRISLCFCCERMIHPRVRRHLQTGNWSLCLTAKLSSNCGHLPIILAICSFFIPSSATLIAGRSSKRVKLRPRSNIVMPHNPSNYHQSRRPHHGRHQLRFCQRVVVHSAQIPWIASPIVGVDRRMLDRIGDEVARATSVVRYALKSRFSAHIHGGGEEFLVLDGVFQDEHGDFPVGSYIRNPPTSSHTPGSETGCKIFVKLWQFDPTDRKHVRLDTSKLTFTPLPESKGVETKGLFADDSENVRLERWAPGASVEHDLKGGGEFFVLEGCFSEGGDQQWGHFRQRLSYLKHCEEPSTT
jgi:anti-sigma factor ChrR (cupin superfamily)